MDKIKKNNKNRLFISISSIISTISFSCIIGIPLISNKLSTTSDYNSNLNSLNSLDKNNVNNIENNLMNNNVSKSKPLVPSVSNFENAKLSTKQGPIVFWGDTIRSLDWFGAERWSVDLTQLKKTNGEKVTNNLGDPVFPSSNHQTDIKRSWVNWEIDRQRNKIWFLSNVANPTRGNWNDNDRNDTSADYKHQYLVSLNLENGEVIDVLRSLRVNGKNDVYRNVSIFYDGTPFIYGLGFSIHRQWGANTQGYSFLGEKKVINENKMIWVSNDAIASKFEKVGQENLDGMDYFFNVIPIGNNRNLFFTVKRANIRSSTNSVFNSDVPFQKTNANVNLSKRNMSITAILLDNDLKEVAGSNEWSNGALVSLIDSASDSFKNKYTFPQRDWYTLLDGRVVTIIYDTLLIFNPSDLNNPTLTKYKIANDGDWVESYTFDTDENIFYKLYNSSKIEKLTLDKSKNGNSHTKNTYYDLSNSSTGIKEYANNFSIYNVTGYSGQIMIINSYFDGYNSSKQLPENIEDKKYGLAAAITNHKSNQGQGDTKGLLNTDKAFQKSADFDIYQNVLNNKLPSEITRNDLMLLNNAFFTTRTDLENNQLKYNPFVKTEMDDRNKTLKVITYLDQIPWFVNDNKVPKDIKPLRIEKVFNSNVDINSRFTWKNSDIDDYDFKNTLPSKVTIEDIKRLSPLVSTISSQITTIGNEKYPKIDYSISEQNDNTGKIKVSAIYSYLPMDTPKEKSNIKTYATEKEYTIFKNGTNKNFAFVTNNGSQSNANINDIPALKELKEANLFPSYFSNLSNKQEFLKFIDVNKTTGYPLEKINISVVANDDNGTLEVVVDPTKYDASLSIQRITYTGLNKKSSYQFNFNYDGNNSFDKKMYRPSDITDEILFKHFISYSGFDSSDLDVNFIPNNEIGNLVVEIILISNYPNDVSTSTGFKLKNGVYTQTHTISGFKTNKEFNGEYQLNFKNDLDISLIKIKELTPAIIKSKIEDSSSNGGLTIDGKKYTNIHELVNLFISSKGTKIPNIEKTNANIIVNMFVNNSGGEITFSITFNSLQGYPNSLTFIQKFTGFAKGNDIVTNDVLTFKDSNQLKLTEKELINKKPSEIANELKANKKSMIYKFLSGTPTGAYKTAIDSDKFTLEINADDNYGILTINIKFNRNDITNTSSLLEYSQTFSGFSHY